MLIEIFDGLSHSGFNLFADNTACSTRCSLPHCREVLRIQSLADKYRTSQVAFRYMVLSEGLNAAWEVSEQQDLLVERCRMKAVRYRV